MRNILCPFRTYTITFHYPKNYGAFLQSYALQKITSTEICNYSASYYMRVGRIRKYFPILWRVIAKYRDAKFDKSKFHEYKMLKLSRQFINPYCCYNDFNASVGIFGSDQIWNPTMIPHQEKIYFGNFADFSKRISYAASLGMSKWPKDFEQKVLPLLQRFNAISVREESAVAYLTSLGLKNVVCVCDPTILHTADFYRKEFPYDKINSDFTFVYRIRESIPQSVVAILGSNVKEVYLQRKDTIISVTDWLANIDNAKFIVTDSFHCAVFCILFHKPFLVLPNRGTMQGMNERFETLLGKTNLKYRVLSSDDTKETAFQRLNTPIEWEKIDLIIEEWRSYSANWLKNALEM